MKQLGLAVMQYVQDYDELFPLSLYVAAENGAPCTMTYYVTIQPYLRNIQVMVCPSNPTAINVTTAFPQIAPIPVCGAAGRSLLSSYNGNYALFADPPGNGFGGRKPAVSMAQMAAPADIAMFYDGYLTLPGGTAGFRLFDSPVDSRHSDMLNAAWADGHAKVVRARETGRTGPAVGGQTIKEFLVTDAVGPIIPGQNNGKPFYQGKRELWGPNPMQ
jgi:prepilin-type processing-associated H-X9-DG protein